MATPAVQPATRTPSPDERLAQRLGGENRRRALTGAILDRLDEIAKRGGGELNIRIRASADGIVRDMVTSVPVPI